MIFEGIIKFINNTSNIKKEMVAYVNYIYDLFFQGQNRLWAEVCTLESRAGRVHATDAPFGGEMRRFLPFK